MKEKRKAGKRGRRGRSIERPRVSNRVRSTDLSAHGHIAVGEAESDAKETSLWVQPCEMQHLSSTVSMSATQALMPSRALHGCPWQVRLLASHPPPRAAVTSCARAPQISSTLTRVMCPGVARKGRLRSPSQRQQAVVLASSMASWSAVWNNTGPAWEIPLYIHAIRQFGPVLLAALGSIVCTKLLKHLSGRVS